MINIQVNLSSKDTQNSKRELIKGNAHLYSTELL